MTLPSPIRPSDPQIFTMLYNRFFEEVYAYARQAGEADGFDYVHDAFAYLYSHDKEFPDVEKVRNFIIKCVRRKAINKHKHPTEEIAEEFEYIEDEPVAVEGIFIGKVMKLFDRLPKETRNALELRYIKGLKVKEIAVMLGINECTVRSQCTYGINKLRLWNNPTYTTPKKQLQRAAALKELRSIIDKIGKREFERITGDKIFDLQVKEKVRSNVSTSRILENIERYKLKMQK